MTSIKDKTILVTGGSGYIGSITAQLLVDAGAEVINIDRAKPDDSPIYHYPFDIDNHQVRGILELTKPDAIIHLAANHSVPLSVSEPADTYYNNVANSISLFRNAVAAGVKHVVFSSSSSVYGNCTRYDEVGWQSNEHTHPSFTEEQETKPESPYGESKLMVEQILADFSNAYDFTYTSLRYFNAAGSFEGRLGYKLNPKAHLIPIVVDCLLNDKEFTINGTDYNTKDGTCVRDYTHVVDVAQAHIDSLEYLFDGGRSENINIGSGSAHSIKQVIACAEELSGKKLKVVEGTRRAGDPSYTRADISKAHKLLGWEPEFNLSDIVGSELLWQQK